jgi:hypothetical protein
VSHAVAIVASAADASVQAYDSVELEPTRIHARLHRVQKTHPLIIDVGPFRKVTRQTAYALLVPCMNHVNVAICSGATGKWTQTGDEDAAKN